MVDREERVMALRAEGQCGRDVRDVEPSANQLSVMRGLLSFLANQLLEMQGCCVHQPVRRDAELSANRLFVMRVMLSPAQRLSH